MDKRARIEEKGDETPNELIDLTSTSTEHLDKRARKEEKGDEAANPTVALMEQLGKRARIEENGDAAANTTVDERLHAIRQKLTTQWHGSSAVPNSVEASPASQLGSGEVGAAHQHMRESASADTCEVIEL